MVATPPMVRAAVSASSTAACWPTLSATALEAPMSKRRKKNTGRVFQDPKGSGIWWARLPEKNGKAGPRWRVKDKATGDIELADKLRQMQQGVKVYLRGDTFGDWIEHCNETAAN